jgi:polyisoprenoid-binding protein YceI
MAVMSQAEAISRKFDVPKPGRYRISPADSTVTIRTRHFFGLGAVRATLALRDGRILVAEPPQASAVQARFATSTFQSGNEARDAAVLSPKLLGAEAYPSLSFTSTDLLQEQGQWSLRGELEVRGVTRLVEARITALAVHDAGTTLSASAHAGIDRYDFGITTYRGLAARRLTINLDIIAHREQS